MRKFKVLARYSLRKSVLLLVLLCCAPFLHAQNNHPYLQSFSAEASEGKIFLFWITRPGFSCQDIRIERSTDSVNFQSVGTYFGLCGDTSAKSYYFTVDQTVLNTRNYIRLNLGRFGFSDILGIDVIQPLLEPLVIPHPINSASVLYFKNDLREDAIFNFYSVGGELIHTAKTRDNRLDLSRLSAYRGLIVYELRMNSLTYRGRLFVGGL